MQAGQACPMWAAVAVVVENFSALHLTQVCTKWMRSACSYTELSCPWPGPQQLRQWALAPAGCRTTGSFELLSRRSSE